MSPTHNSLNGSPEKGVKGTALTLVVSQANILSMEEEIIDATTEEGQKQFKEIEAAKAAVVSAEEREKGLAEKYDDPE